jgi:hypothetical protein
MNRSNIHLYAARLRDVNELPSQQIYVHGEQWNPQGENIPETDLVPLMIEEVASARGVTPEELSLVWVVYTSDPFAGEETIQ